MKILWRELYSLEIFWSSFLHCQSEWTRSLIEIEIALLFSFWSDKETLLSKLRYLILINIYQSKLIISSIFQSTLYHWMCTISHSVSNDFHWSPLHNEILFMIVHVIRFSDWISFSFLSFKEGRKHGSLPVQHFRLFSQFHYCKCQQVWSCFLSCNKLKL